MPTKKLLIIHQGALGDFVMTFPSLIGFRKTHAQIDALCQKKLGELARNLNLIEMSYPLESAAVAHLYADHPETVDVKTATLLQSYERIVLFSFSRRLQENIERLTGPNVLRIPPRPPAGEKIHVSRFLWIRLVEAGLFAEAEPPSLPTAFIQLSPPQRCREPESVPVLIHPGSGSKRKNWPLKNFIELEKMLRKDGLRAQFVLGPAEISLWNDLAAVRPPKPPVHIIDDLLQALSLIKRACGFIGNDSGLSHLAAITGLPVTAVFGPSDPARWKPLGPAVAVVRSELACSPCHETDGQTCNVPDCFKGVSPLMVHAVFSGLIRTSSKSTFNS